jgi:hypothetical protein
MSPLLNRWETRLVSLALAVALWLYTSGQVRVERTVIVRSTPEDVKGLDAAQEATAISPAEFRVVLSVPSSRMDEIVGDLSPRLTARAGQVKPSGSGTMTFPITGRLLGLPADVRIISTDPENLREIAVSYDRREEADLLAEPPAVSGLPLGVRADVVLDRTLVRVRAGSRTVEKLKADRARVRFDPIDLSTLDIAGGRVERVLLKPLTGDYKVIDAVRANVVLVPVEGDRRLASMPVRVLTPEDFSARFVVRVDPALVAVTLHGPQELLKALDPEREITAYVSLLKPIEPGVPVEVPVQVTGPSWLTAEPLTTRVVVTASGGSAPGGSATAAQP